MIRPMKSPSHPFQAWLTTMRRSLDLIEKYQNIDIENLRLEFACASRQLQLGWPLIAHLKTQTGYSPPSTGKTYPNPVPGQPNLQSPSSDNDSSRPALTETEQKMRFLGFCTHAQQQIFTACSHQGIPLLNKHDGKWKSLTYEKILDLFIRVAQLDHRKHLLANPTKWSYITIAPKLFAKSICILTDSPHEMIFAENLSFLSARLEEALGLLNDMQKIKWQGKTLPPANPTYRGISY